MHKRQALLGNANDAILETVMGAKSTCLMNSICKKVNCNDIQRGSQTAQPS